MTNEEILNSLRDIATYLPAEKLEQAAELLDAIGDRLIQPPTQVTLTTRIEGSPEMIGIALGEFISRNTAPEDIARIRNQIFSQVLQRSTSEVS